MRRVQLREFATTTETLMRYRIIEVPAEIDPESEEFYEAVIEALADDEFYDEWEETGDGRVISDVRAEDSEGWELL